MNVGIVGFGYMGHYHLEKFRRIEGVNVTAVYDSDTEKSRQAEKEGLTACESLKALLEKPEIELIVISTPNQVHKEAAIEALQAGKNVLCEKPAVLCEQELLSVLEASKKSGKFFTLHHNRRWDKDYLMVKDAVDQNTVGKAVMIESRVLGERGVVFGWRANPDCGGGMLYDWAPHLIDQFLQMYQGHKVNYISAQLQSVLTPAVDDFVFLSMFFDHGVRANIHIGTMALQKLPRWYVYGDRGSMKLDDFSGEKGGIARIKGNVGGFDSVLGKKILGPSRTMAPLEAENLETLPLCPAESDELAYHKNIAAAVLKKEELYVKEEDILRETRVMDAAFLAAKNNSVIKVSI